MFCTLSAVRYEIQIGRANLFYSDQFVLFYFNKKALELFTNQI